MSEPFFKPDDFAAVLPDLRYGGFSDNGPLRDGAAAAANAKRDAEIERLRAENAAKAAALVNAWAERDRLREALQSIAYLGYNSPIKDHEASLAFAMKTAHAALEGT